MLTINDFLSFTKSRKQTYEFSDKEVKEKDLLKILESARWAPSCGNAQPWHFIIVKNKENIKKLTEATHFVNFPFIHPYPPLLIAFVLDGSCLSKYNFCSDGSPGRHISDAYLCVAMAIFNSILEAHDLGISTCILTPRDHSEMILKLRKEDQLLLFVGFGYEKKGAFHDERSRKELSTITSYEYYGGKIGQKKLRK